MSNGLNKCSFIGNLGKDPEMRATKDGGQVASISSGCGESWKDKQGQKQEHTEWINCTAFGRTAEIIGQYLKKGSKVYIEGKQKTEKYQAKDGTDRYSTKIIIMQMLMLDSKPKQGGQAPQQGEADNAFDGTPGFDDIEIPF